MDPFVKKVLWFGGAYLLFAGAAAGYILLTGTLAKRTGFDAELAAQGSTLYAQHCAKCHGVNLEGQPGWETRRRDGTIPAPPQNDSGHTWEHADRQIFDIIKLGGALFSRRGERSEMPAFRGTLSDAEIWAVIAFLKSRWSPEIRDEQTRANLLGGLSHH